MRARRHWIALALVLPGCGAPTLPPAPPLLGHGEVYAAGSLAVGEVAVLHLQRLAVLEAGAIMARGCEGLEGATLMLRFEPHQLHEVAQIPDSDADGCPSVSIRVTHWPTFGVPEAELLDVGSAF